MHDVRALHIDAVTAAGRLGARTLRAAAAAAVGIASAGAVHAATSDLLVVLGADGRSHVAQHTLSSGGAIVSLELASPLAPEAIRFTGPERATFADASRRSPTRVALWSGTALVRAHRRYDDAIERDATGTFRLRVPSVPEQLTVEDGELLVSSLTWAFPEELEIVSFDGGEARGRWFMTGGMLTFEQRGGQPVALDVAWRLRDVDAFSSAAPPTSTPAAGSDTLVTNATEPDDEDADGVPDHRDVCLDDERPERVDGFGCRESADDGDAALVLDGIVFPAGESYLDAGARAVLDRLARALLAEERAGGGIDADGQIAGTYEVAAHTDGAGSRARNLGLSARRAEAVRHYLMLRGVDPNRLRARGYGEARPLADDRTAAGRRANRRIELARVDER